MILMKNSTSSIFFLFILTICISACSEVERSMPARSAQYIPDDKALYDTIVHLDSVFFDAYNNCSIHLDTYGSFFSDNIEFYHDKGGLMTSKQEIIDATERNVCGKVTRTLVKGSIEVYPIKEYGAVEMGLHSFRNNTDDPSVVPDTGKFVVIWQNKNSEWKIARVISLH